MSNRDYVRAPDADRVEQLIGPVRPDRPVASDRERADFERALRESAELAEAVAIQESIDMSAAAQKAPRCHNCARGDHAMVYIMCERCGTMAQKALHVFMTAPRSRMCMNPKCLYTNATITSGRCISRDCERLIELVIARRGS